MTYDEAVDYIKGEGLEDQIVEEIDAPTTICTECVEVEPGFYLVDRITKSLASERFDRRFQAQQALAELDAETFAIVEFCAEGVWGR